MKLFIASDLHGSALWCARMLDAYRASGACRLVLLGDILYHGPRNDLPDGYDPKAVIAMLNPLADEILAVRGNCEAEVDAMVLDFPVTADYGVIFDGERALYLSHGHREVPKMPSDRIISPDTPTSPTITPRAASAFSTRAPSPSRKTIRLTARSCTRTAKCGASNYPKRTDNHETG